jgi:predicted dehydrogenase
MKIGCIGSGFIMADCHLVAYRQNGFNPIAISSRNRSHAQAAADRHKIKKVYASYQELLNDKEIEIIDIAVPPNVQLEVIREAVKHSDHIIGIPLHWASTRI